MTDIYNIVSDALTSLTSEIWLSKRERLQVQQIFYFCINQANTQAKVPYNVLIECDDMVRGEAYARKLAEICDELRGSKQPYQLVTMEELIEESDRYLQVENSILVIREFSVQEDVWENLYEKLDAADSIIKIFVTDKTKEEQYLGVDSHFYWVFLNLHLILHKMNEAELVSMTEEFLPYNIDAGFHSELTEYVKAVYPNAFLKNEEFAHDLSKHIQKGILSLSKIPDVLSAKNVPMYNKNRQGKEEAVSPVNTVMTERVNKCQPRASEEEIPFWSLDETFCDSLTDRTLDKPEGKADASRNVATDIYSKDNVVLILALSTFIGARELKISNYVSENTDENDNPVIYHGRYQLEPVPKVLADRLAAEKPKAGIDKIIMLCTPETKQTTVTDKNGEKLPKTITIYDEAGKASHKIEYVSEVDYFKHQVKSWLKPGIPDEDQFKIVELDEKNPQTAIQKTVEILRGTPNLRLYMDNHGGFRTVSVVMEAITFLLGNELKTKPEFYTVLYKGGQNGNNLVTVDSSVDMFDFTSGINEFLNYGRIESLKNYWDNTRNLQNEKSDLLSIIEKISEGIQLCDIPAFERGLDDLNTYYSENRKSSNIYIQLFENTIQKDYGGLISGNSSDSRSTLDEIEWSTKKGFYQQAITLVEARMPKYFLKDAYNNTSEKFKDAVGKCKGVYSEEVFIWNRLQVFFSGGLLGSDDKDPRDFLKNLNNSKLNSYGSLGFLRFKFEGEQKNTANGSASGKITANGQLKYYAADQKKATNLIRLHFALRSVRNHLNHAGAEELGISTGIIRCGLETYVKWVRELSNLNFTIEVKDDDIHFPTQSSGNSGNRRNNGDNDHFGQRIQIPEGLNFPS